ncbi:hypothetical protein [Stenotrophomonas mori]|uniref:Sigma-70 family RNA polymerase sigma factor n=1 Tax=Stenotrophomonas mori TaxID=2871096 RepID=A0ABT0SCN4_9GAMM|nr:hypothetical protein [Stenotrophomonas mori]MCL7713085.1 hypothetical protein [Stenotrophomonas mori]
MESVPAATAATEESVRSYLGVDYRRHYAALLRQHPAPPDAIAELCLFRFWLACRAHLHAHGAETARLSPRRLPADWPLPRQVAGFDIAYRLGAWFEHLLESRLDLYDRFFLHGRQADDPLGLDAAALALTCQLFVQPPAPLRAALQAEARTLFARLAAAGRAVPGA